MTLIHSKNKRPEPLKDKDYDHEIQLVDHTKPVEAAAAAAASTPAVTAAVASPSPSPSPSRSRPASPSPTTPEISTSDVSERVRDDVPLKKRISLREKRTRKKWQELRVKYADGDPVQQEPVVILPAEENQEGDGERGRSRRSQPRSRDSAPFEIDVLYENQRGGILCGLYLFSSAALGWGDPSPWTNIANKTSPTNITNAQVPDPSWEWAWPEWVINHDDGDDKEGWEYAFAFTRKCSWHKPKWYNSFVRRRAWIRKRVKRHTGYHAENAHMLNDEYFTIHAGRSRSRATTLTNPRDSRYSIALSRREEELDLKHEEICDIGTLMSTLRVCRIDREKMEAVESFIKHGGEELHYLAEHMREIMKHFIFQASRRLLLSKLIKDLEDAIEVEKGEEEGDEKQNMKQRTANLEKAVRAADEEVKRLEYWSDIKEMAGRGETKGAVDDRQGWRESWESVDRSGARDVITEAKVLGVNGNGNDNGSMHVSSEKEKENGKKKANGNGNGNGKGKESARD